MILLLIFLSLISLNIHAQKSSESCPEGYVFESGDVPGWGSDLGGRIRLSRQECAIKCNKNRDCHSFEHSKTKNLCNLNRIAEPTKGPFEDFAFCIKQKESSNASNDENYQDLHLKYRQPLDGWDKYEYTSPEYGLTSVNHRKLRSSAFRRKKAFEGNFDVKQSIKPDRVLNESDDSLKWFRNHIQSKDVNKHTVNGEVLSNDSSMEIPDQQFNSKSHNVKAAKGTVSPVTIVKELGKGRNSINSQNLGYNLIMNAINNIKSKEHRSKKRIMSKESLSSNNSFLKKLAQSRSDSLASQFDSENESSGYDSQESTVSQILARLSNTKIPVEDANDSSEDESEVNTSQEESTENVSEKIRNKSDSISPTLTKRRQSVEHNSKLHKNDLPKKDDDGHVKIRIGELIPTMQLVNKAKLSNTRIEIADTNTDSRKEEHYDPDNASTLEEEYADPDNIETLEEEYDEKIEPGDHLFAMNGNLNFEIDHKTKPTSQPRYSDRNNLINPTFRPMKFKFLEPEKVPDYENNLGNKNDDCEDGTDVWYYRLDCPEIEGEAKARHLKNKEKEYMVYDTSEEDDSTDEKTTNEKTAKEELENSHEEETETKMIQETGKKSDKESHYDYYSSSSLEEDPEPSESESESDEYSSETKQPEVKGVKNDSTTDAASKLRVGNTNKRTMKLEKLNEPTDINESEGMLELDTGGRLAMFPSKVEDNPRNLIGYYKHPYNCDHTIIGACRYLITWFKTGLENEVSFVVIAKDVVRIKIGFANTTSIIGADIVIARACVDKDPTCKPVEDYHMNVKKEVTIDENQNLSNGYSELKSYSSYKVLLTKFVKKFSTTDTTNQDIDIGMEGGVFMFFEGQAIEKPGKYMFIPQRIDFKSLNFKFSSTLDEWQRTHDEKNLYTHLSSTANQLFGPRNLMRSARRYVAPESEYIHLPYQRPLPLLRHQPVPRYQGLSILSPIDNGNNVDGRWLTY